MTKIQITSFVTVTIILFLIFSSISPLVVNGYVEPDKERYYVAKESAYVVENGRLLQQKTKDEILVKDIKASFNKTSNILSASYLIFNPGKPATQTEQKINVGGSNFIATVSTETINGTSIVTGLNIGYYLFRAPIKNVDILGGTTRAILNNADLLITKYNTSEERIYMAFQYKQWNGEEYEYVFVELSTDNDPSGLAEKIGIHFVIENMKQRPIQEYHLTLREMTYYEQYVKTIHWVRILVDLWLVWLAITIFVFLLIIKKKWGTWRKWLIEKLMEEEQASLEKEKKEKEAHNTENKNPEEGNS